MLTTLRPARVLTVLILALSPAVAAAQSRVLVAPSLAAGVVYDDNLFSAPVGEQVADTIWRLSPGIRASRESGRANWFGTYGFDAEMYRDHPSLTTPLARQNGSGFGRFQPSSANTITVSGGYDSTVTASELNLTTGLLTGRIKAWRAHGGLEWKRAASTRNTFTLGYDGMNEAVKIDAGNAIFTHAIDFRATHEAGSRTEVRVRSFLRDYIFDRTQSQLATGVLLGVTHKITRYTSLSVEAGPRLTQGKSTPDPEADILLLRRSGLSDLQLQYTRTITTAVGLRDPVLSERLLGGASYRRVGFAEVGVQAGYYVNGRAETTARVYHLAADVTRRLGGAVSIGATYTLDQQKGRLTTPLTLIDTFVSAPVGTGLGVILPPGDGRVRHSVAMVRIIFSPQIQPTDKPKDTDPAASATRLQTRSIR
jgi:hypothetical protein